MSKKSIFIDAEWYIGGDIFLIGYAYSIKKFGNLYDDTLSRNAFLRKLQGVKFIYFYGPNIGVIENHFKINLRDNYHYINLLKIFRRFIHTNSYKLANIEKKFGIVRKQVEYKKNIFKIWSDWKQYRKKKRIILYNKEDVVNLIKLWKRVRSRHKITTHYLIQNKLS